MLKRLLLSYKLYISLSFYAVLNDIIYYLLQESVLKEEYDDLVKKHNEELQLLQEEYE